jgi:hypothetical protein
MRCQCVGPTIPDDLSCVTGDDAYQASAAVLNVNCAGQIAETAQLHQDRIAGDAGRRVAGTCRSRRNA